MIDVLSIWSTLGYLTAKRPELPHFLATCNHRLRLFTKLYVRIHLLLVYYIQWHLAVLSHHHHRMI